MTGLPGVALVPAILVVLLGAVTLLSLVARGKAPFELLQHFRPHLVVAPLAVTLICLAVDFQWQWALVSFGLGLVNYAAMPARAWLKPDAGIAKKPGLTVVWANVWGKAEALKRTIEWAKTHDADVILIAEHPEVEASVLPADYPHRVDTGFVEAKTFHTRVLVLSRLPVEDAAVRKGSSIHNRPWVSFAVSIGGERVNVAATHPEPPYSDKLLKDRDAQIGMLAATAEPFVIAGDFNTTPWCPGYEKIPGKRVGSYLWRPTWFTSMPLLGLPIDHIMVSSRMKASAYSVGPALGSDHRALMARVHLP